MNLEDLLPGSYKGAEFLLTSSSVKGGNRNAIHAYPNTNRQTVENLGQIPPSFDLAIIIPSDNYAQRKAALIAALTDGKAGVLIHPIDGRIENVMAGPYTLNENLNNLGRGELTVPFFLNNAPGIPEVSGTTINTVIAKREVASTALQSVVIDQYTVTPTFIGNVEAAIAKIGDAVTSLSNVGNAGSSSEYLASVREFASDAALLIKSGKEVASRVMSLYGSLNTLYDNYRDTYKKFLSYFSFGENGDTQTIPVTAGQIERRKATDAFNLLMQAGATIYAYTSAAQLSFDTVDDVQLVEDELDAQYARLMAKGLAPDLAEALTDLRLATADLFAADKLQARRVVEIFTRSTSARLLAFSYYGTSDLGEQIMQLNGLFDPSYMEGTVRVLTE